MRKLRFLVGLIILISLGIMAVLTWRTLAPPKGKAVPAKETGVAADIKLDRVHYTETREGVKEWELEAESALYFKENNTVILNKVKATFFGKNQEKYFLVSEKGKFNTQTKVIEVFDGVKIDSSDGYHMRTRTLKYQGDTRELSTSDPVEMNGPHLRVEGIGLIVDLDRQRLRVLSQVTTTFSQKEMNKKLRLAM